MRYLYTLIFCLAFLAANSQNMVHNPSLEQVVLCPSGTGNFDYAHVAEWKEPNVTSTDYLNACATNPVAGVPHNGGGYQNAYDGVAYGGLLTYMPVFPDIREYMMGTLTPLQVGQMYNVTIHISSGDYVQYGTQGIGVYFSMNGFNLANQAVLQVTPQIDYSSYGVITDSINWLTLTSSFIADSAYNYLIIGSFRDDANTVYQTIGNAGNSIAYYYVDQVDVSASPLTTPDVYSMSQAKVEVPSAFSPNGDGSNDVLYARGNSVKTLNMRIYNRLGQIVFETKNINEGWDGSYKGQLQADDNYGYVVDVSYKDGKTEQKTGSVRLLR